MLEKGKSWILTTDVKGCEGAIFLLLTSDENLLGLHASVEALESTDVWQD